jgi:hypothetical protein
MKIKTILFKDFPEFRPNLTPSQIIKLGSFGGTYWRPIYSSITDKNYKLEHLEYPKSWWDGVPDSMMTSPSCDIKRNKYNANSGTSLDFWESKGWITEQDPYGWFQWYCRFYTGRRTEDDERQVKRWLAFTGPSGRFKNWLIRMIKNKNTTFDDYKISPKIRQGLQHWAYQVTKKDMDT